MTTTLRVNQALHGYRDGHRLLQSSLKLSPESHSLLLTNSDATGPAIPHGFETYLSGFGLPADRVFVFARTWFAHEMDRPGCVWTHSLIVDWDTLRDFADYSAILRAFRRPQNTANLVASEYGVPIGIPSSQSMRTRQVWTPHASTVMAALYSADRRSVVLSADSSDRWEDEVLCIWATQWWTLRRSLSFCTGQLSERPGTRKIDIQVVPQERRFRWRQSDAVLIDDGETPTSPPWWMLEVEHAVHTGSAIDAGLDIVLRASLPADRSAGPFVVQLARVLNDGTSTSAMQLLEEVSHRYSAPTAASGLKGALLGENGVLWKRADDQRTTERELVRYLLLSESASAFDRAALGLRGRLENIWKTQRGDATSLLLSAIRADSSDAIEELVRAACTALPEKDLIDLARSEPGTIHTLAQSRPTLLSQRVLWQGAAQIRRELAAALVRVGADQPSIVSAATTAAAEAGAVDSLAELVSRAETRVFAEVVSTVLNILPSIPGWQAFGIVAALRSRATDVADLWREGVLDPAVGTVSLMMVFEPNCFYGKLLGPSLMMIIATQDINGGRHGFECVGPTFALVAALDSGEEFLVEAGAEAFARVHASAARSSLDQWSLNSLERVLPRLGWRRDWDICERLRLAAAERLMEQRWPIGLLFRLLPTLPEFEWLIRTIRAQRHGRHFLKDAAKVGSSVGATELQLVEIREIV